MDAPKIVHHGMMTFIGISEQFRFNEGYEKCPKFWDEAYSKPYARLFKTMKAETAEEQAVLDNRIGEFALCRSIEGQDAFEYMICGEYQGGFLPENMTLLSLP